MSLNIRSASLARFLDVASELDLDPEPLLLRHGLSRAMLAPTECSFLPARVVIQLLEDAASASNCTAFAALMVERRKLSDIGAISLLLRHQRSARAAIDFLTRHKGLLNDVLAIQVETEGKFSVVRVELISDVYSRQAAELGVGVIISIFRSLLGEHWRPHEAYFSHAAPDDQQIHRRVFRCPLRLGAEYSGFACLTSELDSPSDFSEIELKNYEKFFIENLPVVNRESVLEDARKAISLLMPSGKVDLMLVADYLKMSPRTLQRRLAQEDTTFMRVYNAVRRDNATRSLENTRHSIFSIAEQLGFDSSRSFTRWFSQEFGISPKPWRQARMRKA
ncbi:AraC family transcriptional regulator [Cupriavidus sp. amp6]|uniref:AraC family transcriptional regulator n=1 Tax=Cupriavidus sp. amp6 TaxID=388051 RepID=UPI00048E7BF3|nr:AraC family transcriptional regulator [Cupriavidus sp. amp6]